MNQRDLETMVLRALSHAAGDIGQRPIEPDQPLTEQFQLDTERFFAALARETGIEIPVTDRPRLATFAGCLDYLEGGMEE